MTSATSFSALLRGGAHRLHFYEDEAFEFTAAERGVLPGAPPTPVHSVRRRVVYAVVSIVVGLTGALGNGLVVGNLPYLQGSLQLNLSEIAWLPAAYLVTSALGGALLVKYRQRFGIRSFCMFFLAIHVAVIAAHLLVHGLVSAIAVRAASGFSGTALLSLGVFYMIQAFPARFRLNAVALGVGIPQLAIPLARVLPKDALSFDHWTGLYVFELGMSLLGLSLVMVVRLPPNIRQNSFELLDGLSFALYAAGMCLLGSAFGLGSYLWWTNFSWIGWSLAASFLCFFLVFCIEYHRPRPLIDFQWLSSAVFVRWSIIAVVWRVAIAEQSIGAIGMLRDFGLTNDDFWSLSLVILLGAVAGLVLAATMIKATRLPQMVLVALIMVSAASFFDAHSGPDTRSSELFFTQAAIAFATTMFIGPSFIFGLSRVIAEGGSKMTSFVALFGITQAIGSLAGTAFVQTYLFYAQQHHLVVYAAQAEKSNRLVESSIAIATSQYGAVIADPVLRSAQGAFSVSQQIMSAARIAAYDDVFFGISVISLGAAALLVTGIAVGHLAACWPWRAQS